jgi:hypothetical protein
LTLVGDTYAPITTTRVALTADTTINVQSEDATVQDALDYATTIDFGGHTLPIQLANGTMTSS